jgi:hypothetical protein
MGKNVLKERYEKICKEDRELFEQMEVSAKNMMKLSADGKGCQERIMKIHAIEKELGAKEDVDYEIRAPRMVKLLKIEEDYIEFVKRALEFIQYTGPLKKTIFDFVEVINSTYDKLAANPRTKAHGSKVLHGLEIDLIELQTRYSNFIDEYEVFRKELDALHLRLDELQF